MDGLMPRLAGCLALVFFSAACATAGTCVVQVTAVGIGTGKGIVTIEGGGLQCSVGDQNPLDCIAEFPCGQGIDLLANPSTGSVFQGWALAQGPAPGKYTACPPELTGPKCIETKGGLEVIATFAPPYSVWWPSIQSLLQ